MATNEALTIREQSSDSLMLIIDRMASSPEFDVAKLKELLEVKERWERNEARKAFVVAMNAFKSDPPEIVKNKHVKFGTTEYDHATLDHVCHAVAKGLSGHGISHRWKVEQADSVIRVTCILTHDLGHSEETTLQGAADTSGSKNSIQAIGSTVTYLQRYTLLAATGLAAANADNDGAGDLTNGDLAEQIEWISNACDLRELKTIYTRAYEMFEAEPAALKAVIAAKNKRREELS